MNFPIIRYIINYPSRRVVKVRIEKVKSKPGRWYQYPFKAVSLEPSVSIRDFPMLYISDIEDENAFYFADLSVLTLYKTRRAAEKDELRKINDEYCAARSALRKAQNHYKLKLRQLQDYKHFGEIQKLI